MLPALFLLAVAALVDSSSIANKIVDHVIEENVQIMLDKGLDKIPIPDIHKEFKVFHFSPYAEVNLTQGVFWNTTSLRRSRDASEVDLHGGNMLFTVSLRLEEAKAQFQLDYRLGSIKGNKNVTLEFQYPVAEVNVTVQYDEDHNCSVSLEMRLETGAPLVGFNPGTAMNNVETIIFLIPTFFFNTIISDTWSNKLYPVVKEYLDEADICGTLPF